MTEQTETTGEELARFYFEKAADAGLTLEHDDELLITQAADTADLIAELQADIDRNGAMLTSAAGTSRTNPAAVEIRQQRTALAKLTTLIAHRIDVADSGVRPRGVQPGSTRGPYAVASASPRRGARPMRKRGA
ncbi:hypothetical protein ACFWAY_23825 [Rhodococcus sp. NPDC059968]|uniref:hypothetical protein n=1 Tax=Rhodococcus sp. NPDC059968 TaxID=3347017 RepID=UPI0036722F20